MDIGKRLRHLRLARGLSQSDIVRRTGLMAPYVSFIECGHKVPQLRTLEKWAEALRVPLYQFFLPDGAVHQRSAIVRLNYKEKRLFNLLRRMDERDRRLLLSVASTLARQKCKDGRRK